jgi:PAS domain S-box-containing protein
MNDPGTNRSDHAEILVVEDSPTQAELLKHHLAARGYKITVAGNGKEALVAARQSKTALVISDVVMPEMDGYTLCKEIKSLPVLKDVPVILLTSLSKPRDVLKGLECGADNFIRKPYDDKYLLSRVDYVLTNRELRKTERMQVGVQLYFGGQKYFITAEKQQILDLLISTYEGAVQINEELETKQRELVRERGLLRTLMDNVPDFIYFKDTASRFTTINPAHARALGVSSPEDALGKTDFDYLAEEFAREAFADEQEILRTGKPLIGKVEEARRQDGRSIWVSATKMLIRDVHGKVIGTFGVSRDITERKQAEEASQLRAEVLPAAGSAEHIDTAMSSSLEKICRLKGWQLGQAWVPGKEHQFLRCFPGSFYTEVNAAEFREMSLDTPLEKGVGLPGRVWENGTPLWIDDVTKDFNFPRIEAAARAGLKAAFGFPIHSGEKLIAIFEFFSPEIRDPDPHFLKAVEKLGSDLGNVFERKYAEEALRASEERFRALAETANDAIVSADQQGNIIHWNKGAERTFGYSAAETLGKPLTIIMPERFRAAHRQGLERYRSTGEAHVIGKTVELVGRRKDGTEFPLELSLSSWKTGPGAFFTGIIRDITERKRAEEEVRKAKEELEIRVIERTAQLAQANEQLQLELAERKRAQEVERETHARFRFLFAHNPLPMWVYDTETLRFLEVNDAAVAHYGYSREEFSAMRITDIRPAEDVGLLLEDLKRRRPDLQSAGVWRHRLKDGRTISVEINSHRLHWVGREAVLVVAQDITERKRVEEEIKQLNESLECCVAERTSQLVEANKQLEAFSYTVAHDLRAPLRQIDGFAHILVEDFASQLDPTAAGYLQTVRDGAQKMGRMVDDLLKLARLDRKQMELKVTSLNSVVDAVVKELQSECPARQIEWHIGSLPSPKCDPGLMKQVFANLLSNAVKYTRRRERAVIQVDEVMLDGQGVIVVRDNGVGFDLKHADKLFGVFQRLHLEEEFEGTGVGLATVQRIIHKHGGRIWAEAAPDKGATFYFTLGEEYSG